MDEKAFELYTGSADKMTALLDTFAHTARPENAYGEAVVAGEHTVIPAAEVSVSMGVGFGGGGGPCAKGEEGQEPEMGQGMGGGGGGISMSRPVAMINIGPHGVSIKPIIDVTKITLAAVTALGSMLVFVGRIARGGR